MSTKKIIAGLAIAAGLVFPATASASVTISVDSERWVDFYAQGHCLNVDVKELHRKTWESIDPYLFDDDEDRCYTHEKFYAVYFTTSTKYFRYRVRTWASTKTLRTGWIQVKTTYIPARRINQYVNGRYNDDFFNVCINGEGGPLHSANHGNLYCIDPATSARRIALRKP